MFLEAHRQNSVNFLKLPSPRGALRFGELSLAFLLQIILPLLFFIGFSTVAQDRENGTLKVLLSPRSAMEKEILYGKTPWSFLVAQLFFPSTLCDFPWIVCFFCCRNGRLALDADRNTLLELFKFLLCCFCLDNCCLS